MSVLFSYCFRSYKSHFNFLTTGDINKTKNSIAPCKKIQDSLCFWIPRRGFRISITGFKILDSGFQSSVGFRIPWAVLLIPRPKIPDSTSKYFPDSIQNPDSFTWGEQSENNTDTTLYEVCTVTLMAVSCQCIYNGAKGTYRIYWDLGFCTSNNVYCQILLENTRK